MPGAKPRARPMGMMRAKGDGGFLSAVWKERLHSEAKGIPKSYLSGD